MTNLPALYNLPDPNTSRRSIATRCFVPAFGAATFFAWWATQHVAAALRYDPRLGRPWWPYDASQVSHCRVAALMFVLLAAALSIPRRSRLVALLPFGLASAAYALSRGPLYTPLHFFQWYIRYRSYGPLAPLFLPPLRAWLIASGTVLIAAAIAFIILRSRLRLDDIHGSARWADRHDIQSAKLIARPKQGAIAGATGLFLGFWKDSTKQRALYDAGNTHVFVFAPTRSGKGVGIVIPNLLTWPHSVLVHDIKGENWAATAGYRAKHLHQVCLRFDPTATNGQTARYNPLLEIRLDQQCVHDAQQVADILVDPNGDKLRDHWDRTAHALLTAVILHVLYTQKTRRNLAGCAYYLSTPGRTIQETLDQMIDTQHSDPHVHETIASIAQAVKDKSSNERSGVISTALSFLDLYRNPIIARNTEVSDFRLLDLMHNERALSLYLTVPPSNLSLTRPIMRLFLNQACRRLTEQLEFKSGQPRIHYKHQLLLMLDEFPALGRLPFFQESLAYLAGYGIRAVLITQDLSQHHGIYGREESITSNCHTRIAFTPNKPDTAQLLSAMAGEMTVHQSKSSHQYGGWGSAGSPRVSVNQTETRRHLLTPDEALRLPGDASLIFVSGLPPIYGLRAKFFEDPVLSARSQIAPPPADTRLCQHTEPIPPEDSDPPPLALPAPPRPKPGPQASAKTPKAVRRSRDTAQKDLTFANDKADDDDE